MLLIFYNFRHYVAFVAFVPLVFSVQVGSAARFTCTSSSVRVSWSRIEIRARRMWRSADPSVVTARSGIRTVRRAARDSARTRSYSRTHAARPFRSSALPLTARCSRAEDPISVQRKYITTNGKFINSEKLSRSYRFSVSRKKVINRKVWKLSQINGNLIAFSRYFKLMSL